MFSIISEEEIGKQRHVFKTEEVTFGDESCDFVLPGHAFDGEGAVVKIKKEETGFSVMNIANDPFITLNDFPFGKQPLCQGDRLQIFDSLFIFEESLENREEKKTSVDLEALFLEVESLDQKLKTKQTSAEFTESEEENKKVHLGSVKEETSSPLPIKKRNLFLKKIIICFFSLFFLALSILPFWFFWMSEKSHLHEMRAAAGVSDVAMALTYAQLNHIRSNHQNWSDPEFLKNNLSAVIAPQSSLMQEIDSQGRFCRCAYLLRIYTSPDLSRFLVIAQPSASLFQWLFPKAAIVVDSFSMELRKTYELKTLNRLLVHANVLDETNAKEISEIVKQGHLILLDELAKATKEPQFDPPKALSLFKPGAEGYIYNAPRYHYFGERFLERAASILENPDQPYELAMLNQESKAMMKFQDVVLFTSKGIHAAVDAQKSLAFFLPGKKFLIAYIRADSQGKFSGSHLLMNEEHGSSDPLTKENEVSFVFQDSESETEDHFVEVSLRELELSEISLKISDLLGANDKQPILGFEEKLEKLIEQYFLLNQKFNHSKQEKELSENSTIESLESLPALVEEENASSSTKLSEPLLDKENFEEF